MQRSLYSVVDTTVVGLTQKSTAVTQLAALGPATTFIDSLLYSTYFLSIATTNKIANALALKDRRAARDTASQVVSVAALLGLLCTLVCWVGAPTILGRILGKNEDAQLLYYATRYVYIRAATAVCAVTGVVLQSICLASLDTRTPIVAVAVASVLNIVGDIVWRGYGVLGAASATAVASIASAGILLRAVWRKQWRQWNVEGERLFRVPDRKSLLELVMISGP